MKLKGSTHIRLYCRVCKKQSRLGKAAFAEEDDLHYYILQGHLKGWEVKDEEELGHDKDDVPICFGLCPECQASAKLIHEKGGNNEPRRN